MHNRLSPGKRRNRKSELQMLLWNEGGRILFGGRLVTEFYFFGRTTVRAMPVKWFWEMNAAAPESVDFSTHNPTHNKRCLV
jgi:hypothetical protein